MKFRFIIIVIAIWTGTCITSFAQPNFSVTGKIGQQAQGMIYLVYKNHGKPMLDSSEVRNGVFSIKGELGDPVFATLTLNPHWTEDHRGFTHTDFQSFFLDATPYSVIGNGTLKTSVITGGKVQEDYIAHGKPLEPLNKKMDALVAEMTRYRTAGNDSAQNLIIKKMNDLHAKVDSSDSAYVTHHYDSYVAYTIWKNKHRGIVEPEVDKEFIRFSPAVRQTEEGKKMAAKLEVAKRLSVGKTPLDFTLPQPEGKMLSLSDLKGKNVLLYFWYKNFAGFDDFAFNISKMQRQLGKRNFVILAVYYDIMGGETKETWTSTLKEYSFNWLNVSDLGGVRDGTVPISPAAKYFGLDNTTLPQAFLIGPDGTITARHLRLQDRDLYLKVEKMLK